MADLLNTGLAWLAGRLQNHAARPITYRRGAESVTVDATLGRKDFEADSQEGRLYVRTNDFLVPAAALVLGGGAVLPERGDLIDVVFGSETATFEVLAQDGVPPWEYTDPHQTLLRIHTKRVA